jgi:hypothetical protein
MTTSSAELTGVRLFDEELVETTAERSGPRGHLSLLWRASWVILYWATFGGTLIAITWLSFIPRQQALDTGAARHVRRIGAHTFEAEFPSRLPQGCLVGCGGFELTKSASAEDVVRVPGRFWTDAERGIVRWSPRAEGPDAAVSISPATSNAIPRADLIVPGELLVPLGKKLLWFLIPAGLLATSGLAVAVSDDARLVPGFASFSLQEIVRRASAPFTLRVSESWTGRAVLVGAVGVGLGLALLPDWNRLVTCPDSRSYVENRPIRTPLTGWWIAAFDSERTQPREQSVPTEHRTIAHWGQSHRYVTAVRAWKVLFVGSACVFAWWLASMIPWWMAASFLLAAAAFDGSRGAWSSGMSGYLDALLSEPLSDSLLLLLLASVVAYFLRPGWPRGLAIGVSLNLLILARPASIAFAAVIGCVWLLHWKRDGLGLACRRAGGLALLVVGGMLLHCTLNLVEHGHFRQHAFAGMNLMTTALQVADVHDADGFADAKMAQYAHVAIEDAREQRQTRFDAGAADANCWKIAVPAYAAVYGATTEEQPFAADDVLTRVARDIIRRHPREFLGLAASSFWRGFWRSWIHVPLLLTGAAGIWFFWRWGDWRFLFVACLAALPFVAIIPACVTNYPIDRYRSMTSFAEIWSLQLLVGVMLSSPMVRLGKSKRDGDAEERAASEIQVRAQLVRL